MEFNNKSGTASAQAFDSLNETEARWNTIADALDVIGLPAPDRM